MFAQAGNALGGIRVCLGVVCNQCTAKFLSIFVVNGVLVVVNICVVFALSAHPEPGVKYCSIYHECMSHFAHPSGGVAMFIVAMVVFHDVSWCCAYYPCEGEERGHK